MVQIPQDLFETAIWPPFHVLFWNTNMAAVTSFEYALTMYWARLMKRSASEPSFSLDRQSPSIRRLKRAKIFVGKKLDLLMRQTKWVD